MRGLCYRTKPVIIEALNYNGFNTEDILAFCEGQAHSTPQGLIIHTLEGNMKALVGDYIIRGLRGEYYPCKPDVFVKKYEEVDLYAESTFG